MNGTEIEIMTSTVAVYSNKAPAMDIEADLIKSERALLTWSAVNKKIAMSKSQEFPKTTMQSLLIFLTAIPFFLGMWLLLQIGQSWHKGTFTELPIYLSRTKRPRLFRVVIFTGILIAVLLMLGACGLLLLIL